MDRQACIRAMRGLLITVVLIIIVAIAALLGARQYMRWTGQYHFGRIIQTEEGGFVLETNQHALFRINLSKDTTIKQGRDTISGATLTNRPIIIIGPVNNDGEIDAKIIRILKPAP
ncbi:MAG: hypothetical protein V1856_02975 [Candidatus Liptonbacteria bacterium]